MLVDKTEILKLEDAKTVACPAPAKKAVATKKAPAKKAAAKKAVAEEIKKEAVKKAVKKAVAKKAVEEPAWVSMAMTNQPAEFYKKCANCLVCNGAVSCKFEKK